MSSQDTRWSEAVQAAVEVGKSLGGTPDDFNLAASHIVQLLQDSSKLLAEKSHATALFLAITAIEETSKLHAGMYRRSGKAIARGKDPLFKHASKHLLAAAPTVAMGNRLSEAIGAAKVTELIRKLADGEFISLREGALYFEVEPGRIHDPRHSVTPDQSREVLLIAVEIFDDALVGYTDHSMQLGCDTDEIFARWAEA